MLVELLQIGDHLGIALRQRTDLIARIGIFFGIIECAEAQPVGGYLKPAGKGAQFFLRRDRFALQPLSSGMHSYGMSGEPHIEFASELRRAIGRVFRMP